MRLREKRAGGTDKGRTPTRQTLDVSLPVSIKQLRRRLQAGSSLDPEQRGGVCSVSHSHSEGIGRGAKFRMNEHSSFVCGTFPWLETVSSVTGSVSRSERGEQKEARQPTLIENSFKHETRSRNAACG